MQLTPNYKLKKPEGTDPVDIQDFNDNADLIDAALKKKAESSGGDISEMTVKTLDNITTDFPVPVAGEKPKTFLGKVKKFFEDTKSWMTGVCLIGSIVNNCVTDNAKLPLSAAQGKALMDLYTVLNTNLDNKLPKHYNAAFEDNPPAGLAINEWDAGWILSKAYNSNAVELKSHWFDGLMLRKRNNGNWGNWANVITSADSLKVDDYLTLNSGYSLSGDNGMIKFGNVIMLVLTIKKNNGVYPDSNSSPVAKLKKHFPMFQVNTVCVLGTSEWSYSTTDYLYIATNGDVRVCTSATSGNSNFARATICYMTK